MIFVHVLNKKTNKFTIFDSTHLKAFTVSDNLKEVNYLYFINNYYKEANEFVLFDSEKGLNIKSPLAFFFNDHIRLLKYILK